MGNIFLYLEQCTALQCTRISVKTNTVLPLAHQMWGSTPLNHDSSFTWIQGFHVDLKEPVIHEVARKCCANGNILPPRTSQTWHKPGHYNLARCRQENEVSIVLGDVGMGSAGLRASLHYTPVLQLPYTILNIITRVFRNLQISSVIKSPRRSQGDFIHWKSGNF